MKVKELLLELSKVDPEIEIFVCDGEGFIHEVDGWTPHYAILKDDWYGPYALPDDEIQNYSEDELIPIYLIVSEGA